MYFEWFFKMWKNLINQSIHSFIHLSLINEFFINHMWNRMWKLNVIIYYNYH